MSLGRSGRAAALAMLALLIAALWLGPVGAYLDLVGAQSDALAQKAMLLQRYRALVSAPATEAKAAPAVAMLPQVPEAQAAALLQETVKRAAASGKLRIDSLQMLRSEALDGALKLGVRVRTVGDAAGLARFLFAIEAARPVLYPDNLQIQARAALQGTMPGTLDIQLDVSAFAPAAAS